VGETISRDGAVLPYLIICAGQVYLEGWVHNNLDGDILMAVLDTGYSNNKLALEWLKYFERFSAKRQQGVYRLLILDNHDSHITIEFLSYAEEHKIIVYFLPPYATHFLQPLDVVVFQPYKH
jgi:hypothetical protein